MATISHCSNGSRLIRASAIVGADPNSSAPVGKPVVEIIRSLGESGLVVGLAKRSVNGIIAVLGCVVLSTSMSLPTLFSSPTVLKLLLDATQRCSEIGCKQLEMVSIDLGDDAENTDTPFLE
jgi:hypothetical protein